MKSLENNFVSYVQNQQFGSYYLPTRFQYVILSDYYNKHNQIFNLPNGEPIFTNTNIRLRSLVEKLNSKNSLVVLSVSVFPLKTEIRKNLIKILLKKNIKTHFIFENIIASTKADYTRVNDLIKLNNFINK
jgi:sporadic carbohydrate cluster protein (TIGR04323 family)